MSLELNGVAHTGTPALDVRDLTYRYPNNNKLALRDVSFTFEAGTTAIVGPNGAGKSTLVKLISGLLAPTHGELRVRLPGCGTFSPRDVRKSVLFQEPAHLYLTIRQNVTMQFEPEPGEDPSIWAALEMAGLKHVVEALPSTLDTVVGSGFGGQTDLSGGQWQRLALARLIYQDAPLLILDEPVASLDPDGERAVFDLFSRQGQNRIIVFTTHRYDSIPSSTRILVLVDGQITESGTHADLLDRGRDYWSLYTTASSGHELRERIRVASAPPVASDGLTTCKLCGKAYVR